MARAGVPASLLADGWRGHDSERGHKSQQITSVRLLAGDDFAALEAAAPAWQQLADRSIEPNPFYEPWMLMPALRLYGSSDVRLALIEIARNSSERSLIGLFPLESARLHGLPGRCMQSWMHIHCYLGAPLVDAAHAAEAFAALWQWLGEQRHVPALLQLPRLPADGPLCQALTDFWHHRRMLLYPAEFYTRPLLKLAANADQYLRDMLSGDDRRELARQMRRLGERGKLEIRTIGKEDDVDPWLQQFLDLEAAGWKGRAGTAMACSPADREYFLAISRAAFERDRLLLMVMTLDGKLISAMHGVYAGRGAFSMKIAYDETYRQFSPGMLMEMEVVRMAHEQRRCEWIDSCAAPGNNAIRRIWRGSRTMASFVCPAGGFGGEMLVSLLPLLRYGRRLLRRRPADPADTG